jgi:non-ribosomal peptide synthetase component E (peptide arylation enzyme)
MAELERVFRAPVIEAYGMTEAAHQMASNPLPPRPRRPGSVGVAAGPEIAIMDERGTLLGRGAIGEVVIRGPNVTPGYEANPEANARAFTNGWFRTGDQGILDEDGYLRLTGRLKELINRGGEKISAEEVENLILMHPAVQNVACVPMPDAAMGEKMCAYVVLKRGASLDLPTLVAFLQTHEIARFKLPERLEVLPDFPVSTFGKVSKKALGEQIAAKLAEEARTPKAA